MIEQFKKAIHARSDLFPGIEEGELGFTKFCQRIAGPDTKVLFFVTHKKKPLCIIKIMRENSFNWRLKQEAETQRRLSEKELNFVPEVYFDGEIDGRYFYAEQVIIGDPLTKHDAQKSEDLIIRTVESFPTSGAIQSLHLYKIFKQCNIADENFKFLLGVFGDREITFKKGITHGDFGLPNLIKTEQGVYAIDWGRANEKPLWLIDAVYFLVRVRGIKDLNDWEKRGVPALIEHSSIDKVTAKSLYCASILFEILYKKYPAEYTNVVKQISFS